MIASPGSYTTKWLTDSTFYNNHVNHRTFLDVFRNDSELLWQLVQEAVVKMLKNNNQDPTNVDVRL